MDLDLTKIEIDRAGNVQGAWDLVKEVDMLGKPIVKIYKRSSDREPTLVTKPLDSFKLKVFETTLEPLKKCKYVVNFEIRKFDEEHGLLLMEYVMPFIVRKGKGSHLFWNSQLSDTKGDDWGQFAIKITEYLDLNDLICHDIHAKNSGARSNKDLALYDIDSVYPVSLRSNDYDQTFMSPLDAFQNYVGKLKLNSNDINEKFQKALMYDKTAMACFVTDFYQNDDLSFKENSRTLGDNLRKDLLVSNFVAKGMRLPLAIRRDYQNKKKKLSLQIFYKEFLERLIYPCYDESNLPRPGPESPAIKLLEKAKRYYREIRYALQDEQSQNVDPNRLTTKKLKLGASANDTSANYFHNKIGGTSCPA